MPFNREGDRRGTHDSEVETVVRVFPDILRIYNQVLAEGLLKAGVEFIAEPGA